MPVSAHAANNGSQYPEWIDAILRASGFSENVTAWQPLAAMRLTSLDISSGLQIGGIDSGMKRPG